MVGDVVEFDHLPGDMFVVLATYVRGKDSFYIICMGKPTGKRAGLVWKVPYAMMCDFCLVTWRI